MRTDLERIWKLCFNDSPETVKYFFDFRYNPNACAVYIDENVGRPVAMLHMLDANITEDNEIIGAQYIYAAATRPDYRGRGIMRQLIEFARRYAALKNQKYIILVPHDKKLFKYFDKLGFYSCFKVREVFMSRRELISLAGGDAAVGAASMPRLHEREHPAILTVSDIHAVRRDILADREGFVTWDYQSVKYASDLLLHTGGSIVTATNGIDAGYAFCRPRDDNSVFVSEFISSNGYQLELLRRILLTYGQESFEFHLPVYDELFSPFGDISDYAVLSAITGRKPIGLLTLTGMHQPYLGLSLD